MLTSTMRYSATASIVNTLPALHTLLIRISSSAICIHGEYEQFAFDSGQGSIFKISFCGTCSSTLWKESDTEGFRRLYLLQSGALELGFDDYPPKHGNLYAVQIDAAEAGGEGPAVRGGAFGTVTIVRTG
jgi:hypothetical protein